MVRDFWLVAETIAYMTFTILTFITLLYDAPNPEDAAIPAIIFFLLGILLPVIVRKWKG